jgi:hypothetical protein
MNGALSVYSTRVCPQMRPEKCPHMRTKIDRQTDYYLVLSCKTPNHLVFENHDIVSKQKINLILRAWMMRVSHCTLQTTHLLSSSTFDVLGTPEPLQQLQAVLLQ